MPTALMSAFSRGLTPGVSTTPPVASKNWAPGVYIAETAYDTTTLFNQIAARLSADTAGNYKGVLLRYPWLTLEPTQGVYSGFDTIESRFDAIAALSGRRAIIFIQIKTFNTKNSSGVITAYNHAVPQYMRDSATYADPDGNTNDLGEYGEYGYASAIGGPGGYVPNMHVAAVRDRFIALMEAFGARFNDNPNLEAVVINEASIAKPYQVTGTWSRNPTWYANMTTAWAAARTALTNIQCCQWINSDRADMSDSVNGVLSGWVPDLAALGVGFGMPDLCPNEPGFNIVPGGNPVTVYHPGNIYLCQQYAGNAIIMGHASKPALEGTEIPDNPPTLASSGAPQTRQELMNFAVDTVGCTHVLFAHNTGGHEFNSHYVGQGFNTVTDAFVANGASDIVTVTARPTGW